MDDLKITVHNSSIAAQAKTYSKELHFCIVTHTHTNTRIDTLLQKPVNSKWKRVEHDKTGLALE